MIRNLLTEAHYELSHRFYNAHTVHKGKSKGKIIP